MAVRRSRSTTATPTTAATSGSVPSARPENRSFIELGVPPVLAETLAAGGITSPFPIQAATLPDSLAGRDVLGRGRTGSGKTYAFVLPVLARLAASGTSTRAGRPRALILAPTRELATQIQESIAPLARALSLRTLTVFGGVRPGPQISGLRAGVDVLVACPGRLADHLASGHVQLDAVEITVLDEADHMADLGFLPTVRRLLDKTPADGQRLLFSATLDSGVDVLVRRYLHDPVTHSVDSERSPVAAMAHHVLHVRPEARLPVLVDLAAAPGRTLVFTRTKRGATKLARQLVASGVAAVELHGNLAQNARTRNLAAFSEGAANTLVATDIAARGIHVDDVTLVIHADPPVEHKAYLHRSGRTARAGAAGIVVTLMTDAQVSDVRDLTRKAGITPTTTRVGPNDALLAELAPGERIFHTPPVREQTEGNQPRRGGRSTPRGGKPTHQPRGEARATPGSTRRPKSDRGAETVTTSAPRHGDAAAFSANSRIGGRRRSR
ncbi:MAG TPA: DEAD/DEAH box helicase [Pseudonocardiaceae bacterium]|jgi:superfamily II DNA/RNA helicase|nr:DEAD/DEAH box helicase [Pseudonocardiaceae bacterium]